MGETDGGGAHGILEIQLKRSISGGATTLISGDRSTSREVFSHNNFNHIHMVMIVQHQNMHTVQIIWSLMDQQQ